MTHDCIGVGENGPTHKPIEHLMSFLTMPNMLVLRPADGNETAGAYRVAVLNWKRPSVLALSRQNLSQLPGTSIEGVEKGGYIISDNSSGNRPDLIVLGTGSELEIAAKAADELRKEGKTVRVVSLVCWELFEEQSDEYKESVLPESVTTVHKDQCRSRVFSWMAEVRGPQGQDHCDRQVRCECSCWKDLQGVWHHCGERHCGSQEPLRVHCHFFLLWSSMPIAKEHYAWRSYAQSLNKGRWTEMMHVLEREEWDSRPDDKHKHWFLF